MTLPLATAIRPVYLRELTGTGEDTKITDLIAAADKALAKWAGWPAQAGPTFESATYTLFFDGPDVTVPRRLSLPVYPVASITSIHDDTDASEDYGTSDLVDSGDYTPAAPADGEIYLKHSSTHGAWSVGDRGSRRIKVVVVAGYDVGADEALTAAIGLMVAHLWRTRDTIGRQSSSAAGRAESSDSNPIPREIRVLLAPFRRLEVGCG